MRAAADNYQISTIGPGDARQIADLLDGTTPVQVEIPDEAVSAGAERLRVDGHSMLGCGTLASSEDTVRGILEAAAPLLGPRPLLDRDEVASAIVEAAVAFAGSRGTPDDCNAAVVPALESVVEMARPMPTREQIARTLDPDAFDEHQFEWIHRGDRREKALAGARAVWALLKGAGS